jgi:hypothetical protein
VCFVPGTFWLAGHTRSVAYVYALRLGVDVSDDLYPVHFGIVTVGLQHSKNYIGCILLI